MAVPADTVRGSRAEGLAETLGRGYGRAMGETVLILIWLAAWLTGLLIAGKLALWLLRRVVGATGRAWRQGD